MNGTGIQMMTQADRSTLPVIEQLARHIEYLAGDIGERNTRLPDSLRRSVDYITTTWKEIGYDVEHQRFLSGDIECTNVMVTRNGSNPNKLILVGAHYDTVPGCRGANDNATGVAALLEISRLFLGIWPEINVRFVAFANEEYPHFATETQGSIVYAKAAQARREQIALMISLECLGYFRHEARTQRYPWLLHYLFPDRGDFLAFVSNFKNRRLLRDLVKAFQAGSDVPIRRIVAPRYVRGITQSDHRSFWTAGYPAVMITDTAYYRYPHYHSSSDTPDKICMVEFTDALTGIFKMIATVAKF